MLARCMQAAQPRRCLRMLLPARGLRWLRGSVVSFTLVQCSRGCLLSMKVFGFAGWSGSGKTTLVERLLPEFTARDLRVSVIKHAHHGFDLDKPGKDSWRHREAGATQVLMLSSDRWVLMHELRGAPEPTLDEQLQLLEPCDLVLIEGYKAAAVPKLEIHRPSHGKPPLWPESPHVVAVASDVGAEELAPDCPLPVLPINEPARIAEFILDFLDAR